MSTWLWLSARPLSSSVSRAAIEPTIVTSRPSRIQTVPRPMITSQWNLDHGRRSSRAGMRVSIVCSSPDATIGRYPQTGYRYTRSERRTMREGLPPKSRARSATA